MGGTAPTKINTKEIIKIFILIKLQQSWPSKLLTNGVELINEC